MIDHVNVRALPVPQFICALLASCRNSSRFAFTLSLLTFSVTSSELAKFMCTRLFCHARRRCCDFNFVGAMQESSSTASSAAASPIPQMGPMEVWGHAFDLASAQLTEQINPTEAYEFSDLRALHDINIIEHDGAMEYEEKCHELAIAALSAVKAGLGSQHANLAHCRLSRKGAHALAHALACNVTIQRLTLQSNHIDGVVRVLWHIFPCVVAATKSPRCVPCGVQDSCLKCCPCMACCTISHALVHML